jgi:hypothetical protein
MVKGLRLSAFAMAAALFAAPAGAFTSGDRYEVDFDVTAGGRIANLTLAFSMVGQNYQFASRQTSAGVLEWFTSWRSRTEVTGFFRGADPVPTSYRTEGTFRGSPRKVELVFEDGHVVRMDTVPEARDDDREEVSPELRAGTVDPVSALVYALRVVNETGKCDARVKVFDGRQRYDIAFVDKGMKDVPRHYASNFEGAARACEFEWIPIAGRKRNPSVRIAGEQRSGTVYLAPVADGTVMAPVRIEFTLWFGTVVGHLREVRRLPTRAEID